MYKLHFDNFLIDEHDDDDDDAVFRTNFCVSLVCVCRPMCSVFRLFRLSCQ